MHGSPLLLKPTSVATDVGVARVEAPNANDPSVPRRKDSLATPVATWIPWSPKRSRVITGRHHSEALKSYKLYTCLKTHVAHC